MGLAERCRVLDEILYIEDEARSLGIYVVYTLSWRIERASLGGEVFREEIERLVGYLRERYSLETLKTDPVARAYRDFFWRIGVDPTKTRPSGEALVRRALRGSFPRISPVVDAGNIASAYTMVPIGLYDMSRTEPPLRITLSRGGEVFRPIGGGEEVLGRGLPILVDSRGRVLHLYPHRDSIETAVREDTESVLIVGAGVPGVEKSLVERTVETVARLLEKIGWGWCNRVCHRF